MDECDLAQRAVQGDCNAFDELASCYQARVYNVAYRMLGNREDAEDAAQEAFMRAFRAIRTIDPSTPPAPWFRKIAVNVCLNRLETKELPTFEEDVAIRSSEPEPESQIIEREISRQVRRVLLTLPSRYRAVIELRHFQDLSYAEISETLNCPLSGVKSDLFRARKMLAEKIRIEFTG